MKKDPNKNNPSRQKENSPHLPFAKNFSELHAHFLNMEGSACLRLDVAIENGLIDKSQRHDFIANAIVAIINKETERVSRAVYDTDFIRDLVITIKTWDCKNAAHDQQVRQAAINLLAEVCRIAEDQNINIHKVVIELFSITGISKDYTSDPESRDYFKFQAITRQAFFSAVLHADLKSAKKLQGFIDFEDPICKLMIRGIVPKILDNELKKSWTTKTSHDVPIAKTPKLKRRDYAKIGIRISKTEIRKHIQKTFHAELKNRFWAKPPARIAAFIQRFPIEQDIIYSEFQKALVKIGPLKFNQEINFFADWMRALKIDPLTIPYDIMPIESALKCLKTALIFIRTESIALLIEKYQRIFNFSAGEIKAQAIYAIEYCWNKSLEDETSSPSKYLVHIRALQKFFEIDTRLEYSKLIQVLATRLMPPSNIYESAFFYGEEKNTSIFSDTYEASRMIIQKLVLTNEHGFSPPDLKDHKKALITRIGYMYAHHILNATDESTANEINELRNVAIYIFQLTDADLVKAAHYGIVLSVAADNSLQDTSLKNGDFESDRHARLAIFLEYFDLADEVVYDQVEESLRNIGYKLNLDATETEGE